MLIFRYRVRGGEVVGATTDAIPKWPVNPMFADVTDPPLPDGDNIGPKRVLGSAKIHDAGTVRNATQAEIDSFQTSEEIDENIIQRQASRDAVDSQFDAGGRMARAMLLTIKDLSDALGGSFTAAQLRNRFKSHLDGRADT